MENVSVACIAVCSGKVLIARRNPAGQMGGRWEFPGGKAEPGEDDASAVVREMKEEFGIDVVPGEAVAASSFVHNGQQIALHAYRIFVPHDGMQKHYELTEHSEYRWADVEEIASLHFVDSDLLLYPEVKKYIKESC
ncbi:MAG: NUDIX domain-containing protein [Treponema sp.]|nr:NUDIX domain-containing protein [Treponema sp.]